MRNHVRHSRSERTQPSFAEGHERDLALAPFPGTDGLDVEDDQAGDDAFDDEFADVVRLTCPDCGQSIAVLDGEPLLPQHALCASPWNPFGLTVCAGAGRPVAEALPFIGPEHRRGGGAGRGADAARRTRLAHPAVLARGRPGLAAAADARAAPGGLNPGPARAPGHSPRSGQRPRGHSRVSGPARWRAMTIRWIWLVPSTICSTFASRM